ncbi:DNA/RNA helicase, ATP-dependent, DEAH-box type, conserved site-containing protein [Artemisia annua]|uniref:DNA/RNA helicase, ATP-dependent, DEAH-box type, conserved site-containing protein n=1 Tax=Artemisia annua TaxID=35608 RepID=A0A2U1KIM6_ARTAN|nr:DNA/RNA helicase, ATP-dependent, DEAH-box type, conserved site-containing protein [Artemisia annua]
MNNDARNYHTLSKRMDRFMLYMLTAGKKTLADVGIAQYQMDWLDKTICGVLIGFAMGGMKITYSYIFHSLGLIQEDESFLCTLCNYQYRIRNARHGYGEPYILSSSTSIWLSSLRLGTVPNTLVWFKSITCLTTHEDGVIDDEELEVELNEDDEPAFLKGQSDHYSMDMSPVKIVKNPEGSLSRAAALQSALIKERRARSQGPAAKNNARFHPN